MGSNTNVIYLSLWVRSLILFFWFFVQCKRIWCFHRINAVFLRPQREQHPNNTLANAKTSLWTRRASGIFPFLLNWLIIILNACPEIYPWFNCKAEGIFRINAENSQEEYVRDQLNSGIVPDGIDVHCLAGLIKVISSTLCCVMHFTLRLWQCFLLNHD